MTNIGDARPWGLPAPIIALTVRLRADVDGVPLVCLERAVDKADADPWYDVAGRVEGVVADLWTAFGALMASASVPARFPLALAVRVEVDRPPSHVIEAGKRAFEHRGQGDSDAD